MRNVWSLDLACRRNYTKLSDIQKQKLLPNHGTFSVAKSPSQNWFLILFLSHSCSRNLGKTYATPLQMPTSKLQSADNQHFWCTNTAPAAPLEHPKLRHHFLSQKQYKDPKVKCAFTLLLTQTSTNSRSKPWESSIFLLSHLMKIMNKAQHTNLFITYTDYKTNTNKEYQSVSFQRRQTYFSSKSTLQS